MSPDFDWAKHSGDAWTRRWRELDAALSDLAPKLHDFLIDAAPERPFRALDIGCGAGSTTERLARDRPNATIIGCDLSPSLVALAKDRLAVFSSVQIVLGDAQAVAGNYRPFDLLFSRHGVMFFEDPVRAFQCLRAAACAGGKLVFSCFQDWHLNVWASDLASAAADRRLPAPGKEAGAFAFADPAHVSQILELAGWRNAKAQATPFRYVAGKGPNAVGQALDLFGEIGPASRIVSSLPEPEQGPARDRMRRVIEARQVGDAVEFPAAAWLWSAEAD